MLVILFISSDFFVNDDYGAIIRQIFWNLCFAFFENGYFSSLILNVLILFK